MAVENNTSFSNPFAMEDADQARLWQILVADDIEAFVTCNWAAHAKDIDEAAFFGLNANGCADPSHWVLEFPDLASYREVWLAFARVSAAKSAPERLRQEHFRASALIDIQIRGDVATCLKSFKNGFEHDDGSPEIMHWETQYMCRRLRGNWKIRGFVGYLPGRGAKPVIPAG